MNLFYAPLFKASDLNVFLPEQESKHLSKVLRKKEGDIVFVTNGNGDLAETILENSSGKEIKLTVKTLIPKKPLAYSLHLYVAPTKMNDRYEWFLEKAAEIGFSSVTPIICEQSERKVIKAERYEKVLLSAMKQSLQSYLPVLKPALSLKKLLDETFSGACFIAHCEDDSSKTSFNAQDLTNKEIHLLIGPGGDFSNNEIKKALSKGFKAVSFGHSRLRTETAAIYATACVASKHEIYET